MKKVLLTLLSGLIIFLNAHAEPVGYSEREIRNVSDEIAESVMASYNEKVYSKMATHFGEIMFTSFPQKRFEKARNDVHSSFGQILSIKYLGSRREDNNTVAFYGAQTKEGMIVIKLALSLENGKPAVVGLWFE